MKKMTAQVRANRRWRLRHPELQRARRYKYNTRTFIKKYATDEQLYKVIRLAQNKIQDDRKEV